MQNPSDGLTSCSSNGVECLFALLFFRMGWSGFFFFFLFVSFTWWRAARQLPYSPLVVTAFLCWLRQGNLLLVSQGFQSPQVHMVWHITKANKVLKKCEWSVFKPCKYNPAELCPLQLCCCWYTLVADCVRASLERCILHCSRHCSCNTENPWEAWSSPCGSESRVKNALTTVNFDLLPKTWVRQLPPCFFSRWRNACWGDRRQR